MRRYLATSLLVSGVMATGVLDGAAFGAAQALSAVLSKLGATPVDVLPGQIGAALAGGAVDGAFLPWDGAMAAGIGERLKHHTELDPQAPSYATVFVLAMNPAAYKSLPEDLRKVITANSGADTSAWLGRVFEVTSSMSKLVDDKRRPEFAEYAGGAMFELGCHLIDATMTILGPPRKITPFHRATRDDGVLDNQLAVFEYPDAIATVRSSIVARFGVEALVRRTEELLVGLAAVS